MSKQERGWAILAALSVLAWILMGSIVLADDNVDSVGQEWCLKEAELARSVMTARQNGVDMARIVEIMQKKGAWDHAFEKMLRAAYTTHRWASAEKQAEEVTEFSNKILMMCLEVLDENSE